MVTAPIVRTITFINICVNQNMAKYLYLLSVAAINSQSTKYCSLGLMALIAEYRIRVGL